MKRLLLLATTTGYQTRAFGDAAARLGIDLVFATDRCHMLEDPWFDRAIPIRFFDEAESAQAIVDAVRTMPLDGVLAVGDRPTVIAALVAQLLGLPGHPPEAAAIARHKQLTRERLRDAGLRVPWFVPTSIDADPRALVSSLTFPCVIKPVALSGSRGVMRADDEPSFVAAFERLRALMQLPEVRAERNDAHGLALVEGFIPGREYALEGLMHHGEFHVVALFDKPDPLDGPFFEETIYVTPSTAAPEIQQAIAAAISAAAAAIGLRHGPIHAECRVNSDGVFVLEVAARPIGGLCARVIPGLEELLLRHACGASPDVWKDDASASGVMMIPIPERGIFRQVAGVDAARQVAGIVDVQITAKPDQLLVPLPEGASYLGFIFARGDAPATVVEALRAAHSRLIFAIDPELKVLASR
ncbi:MAG TPA: ATP-grasp domain-containing protein [Vicinamibacterales bacterium]